MGDPADWDFSFFGILICLFFSVLSFFEVKHGEKLGEFSHITTFDDLFMEIPHTSEKELTFGPGTCLLPTW